MATTTNAHYVLPTVRNEPNLHYAPGSKERKALQDAIAELEGAAPFDVPAFVGGKEVLCSLCRESTQKAMNSRMPTCAGPPRHGAFVAADAPQPQEGAVHVRRVDS